MTLPDSIDVLVAGAGPTGLVVANALCRQGIAPLVVDADPQVAHTSRAAVVHARTLEALEPLGVTDALIERGVRVQTFRVRDRDRVLVEVGFADLPSRYNFALMCPQDRTEAVLVDRLRAFGTEVHRGWKLTSLHDDATAVRAEITGPSGVRRVSARYVVGADGGHSFVRQAADIPFEGDAYARSFILADVVMDWPLDPLEVTLFFSGQGLVVVAPLPEGHHRIVATVDEAPMHPGREEVQALLDTRGPQSRRASVREVVWSSRFHVHHRVARSFHSGRLVLAGDAAHVHSPAGGQGMNTGIQDAMELADALAAALRGADEAATLGAYARERREVAQRIVALTDRMTRAATLKSPLGREVRNALIALVGHLPPVRRRVAITLAELRNGRNARAVPR